MWITEDLCHGVVIVFESLAKFCKNSQEIESTAGNATVLGGVGNDLKQAAGDPGEPSRCQNQDAHRIKDLDFDPVKGYKGLTQT